MIYTDVKDVSMYKIDCHKVQVTTCVALNDRHKYIVQYDLREVTAAHHSEDGTSIRGSVVEKTVTNHYLCHTFMEEFINHYYLTIKIPGQNTLFACRQ